LLASWAASPRAGGAQSPLAPKRRVPRRILPPLPNTKAGLAQARPAFCVCQLGQILWLRWASLRKARFASNHPRYQQETGPLTQARGPEFFCRGEGFSEGRWRSVAFGSKAPRPASNPVPASRGTNLPAGVGCGGERIGLYFSGPFSLSSLLRQGGN